MSHWHLEEQDGIGILTIDVEGKSANALSRQVLLELDKALTTIETKSLNGLIVRSGKPSGFIVGADVYEFETVPDSARAAELTRAGQLVFNRLEALPFPSVAVIQGNCLGGGLELALACTYRIAQQDEPGLNGANTRLGLPEVRFGIHPGFGGTVRLPPLVGHLPALNMILTGRTLDTRAAKRLGLIDGVAPARHLLRAAHALLAQRPPRRRPPWWQRVPGWAPLRPYVRRFVERSLREKVNPQHYPAPYRVLDLWVQGGGQEREAVSCAELLVSRTSRNLVRLFLLGEDLKRSSRRATGDRRVQHIHVIGAGVMGSDIAIWSAYRGFYVSLQDKDPAVIGRAVKKAHDFFTKRLKHPRAVQAAMDRLLPDLRGNGLRRADLVIEAIVENVEAKRALFKAIEPHVRKDALLATNTSSIPLETLTDALRDPGRLVGLHFFNPVTQMQLVEIVRGTATGEDTLARAQAVTVALDRLPVQVKSSPGFLVNRILMPYLMEAVIMAEEGISLQVIDRAAREFGMPMGPILLADTVGLDVCLAVAETLSGPLGLPVPERLRAMVARGELGKKTRKGFYTFKKGRPVVAKESPKERPENYGAITDRLILRMVNEAMACLREGVAADIDTVDIGMVYGTGFAPFLGGPMRYAEALGEGSVVESLRQLAQEYGPRFNPDPGWSDKGLLIRRRLS